MESVTARDIVKRAVENTDVACRSLFEKDKAFIRFTSGRSKTIEDEITLLTKSASRDPFPLVAMFTEGVSEWRNGRILEFRIPKLAVIIRTKLNTTEEQKLHDSFRSVLHPISNELERQFKSIHFGYELRIERSDMPCMNDTSGKTSLNQLCDAVIFRNLRLKYIDTRC